jgi:hypothetical protein
VPCRVVVVLLALVAGTSGCRRPADETPAARPAAAAVRELSPAPGELALPVREGSIRFAVIGDSGRGDAPQHEVARQMVSWRAKFPFEFVVIVRGPARGGGPVLRRDWQP